MTGEIFSADSSLWMCVWQSTFFLVTGLLGSFLLRRHSARAHQVVLLAMIAAVIVPAAGALVKHYELGVFAGKSPAIEPQRERSVSVDNHEATGAVAAENVLREPDAFDEVTPSFAFVSRAAKFPWRFAALCGWMAASSILAVRLLVTFILGVRLLGRAMPLDCDRIEQAVRLAKARLGLNKDVQICSSPRIRSPVVWCWRRRPVLVVPVAAGQSEMNWTGVLCHELAHWKRRDHIAGLWAELTVCFLPWQPLLWWAKSRLINLSEQACDDWVLATGQSGTDYAESLLDLAPGRQMAFVPGVVRSKKTLAERVRRILRGGCASPRSGLRWSLAVTLITGCVAIGMAFGQMKPFRPSGTIKTKVSRSAVIEQPAFPTLMIKGRILDPNKEAASGARIVALPVTSYGAQVNKEGYFELPWSPTWIEKGQLVCLIASDLQKKLGAVVEVSDPRSPVAVRLEPALSLEGKVVDPNGHRIAEYGAILSLPGEFKCQTPILETTVGAPRVRIFSPIPYGPKYKLTIHAEGYQTKELTVDATDRSKKVIDIGTIALDQQNPAKPVVAQQGSNPDLAKEFHEMYRLEEGEVLKLIKGPFVLGRQEYLHNVSAGFPLGLHGDGQSQVGFRWDGELRAHSGFGGDSPGLRWILRLVLDIQEYDFEIPKGLNVRLPWGDWIVRAGLPVSEQLKALEEIIYAELHRSIHFEKRTVERDVIIASGRYEFKPHLSGDYPDYVPLWNGTLQTSERTVDSLALLFGDIEREIKMEIIDETEPIENAAIRFRWVSRDPEPTSDKLSVLLDDLTKTTSLEFKVERRPGEIWVVTEAKGI